MKRYCATCLWWCWDGDNNTSERHGLCRYVQPGARVSPAAWPITVESDFCAAWEPRDRSIVRCETCEWWDRDNTMGISDERTAKGLRACMNISSSPIYIVTDGKPKAALVHTTGAAFRCSHWRLREERDDA